MFSDGAAGDGHAGSAGEALYDRRQRLLVKEFEQMPLSFNPYLIQERLHPRVHTSRVRRVIR